MPHSIHNRLAELKITLPAAPAPVAAYQPVVLTGYLAFVSGQIPLCNGELMAIGPVPEAISPEEAALAARQCGINALAALQEALGDLNKLQRIIRVGVFVACDASFTGHSIVANGASELFELVLGEAGRHARAATGASSLPLGASVEVEVVAQWSD